MKRTREKKDLFIDKIKALYPQKSAEILDVLTTSVPPSFRVNTRRVVVQDVIDSLKLQGFEITDGPIAPSYICHQGSSQVRLSETKEFNTGEIYMQNIESMLPVQVIAPKNGEKILDLCAAPGSKTTQILDFVNDTSTIVAVEKDSRRYERLLQNLQLYSPDHQVTVINTDGYRLERQYPNFENQFDVVFVDAPCSSEAYVRPLQEKNLKYWNRKKYSDFVGLQKGLIMSGYRMLKPGGRMLYSTCTYSVEENEAVVDWLVTKVPDLAIISFDISIPNVQRGLNRDKKLIGSISNTIRVLPNNVMGAFYLALLEKI